MKTRLLLFVLSICCFLGSQRRAVYAWHDRGHEVIAAIAWEQMTPQARQAAATLLQNAPANSGIAAMRPAAGSTAEQDRAQFLRAACWADDVRSGLRRPLYNQSLWHYTDFFWEQPTPGAPRRQRPDVAPHGELVVRLPALEASLRDAKTTPAVSPSKGTDLAWFLHLMGDIAQPLHCSGRITPAEPTGDQGGNLFILSPLPAEKGKRPANLHFFWDHVIEREYGQDADIRQVAAEILARYPRPEDTRLLLGQYEKWARASQRLAERVAYPATLARDVEPSSDYRERVRRVSQRVMALAGYRLGETLNAVFSAPP